MFARTRIVIKRLLPANMKQKPTANCTASSNNNIANYCIASLGTSTADNINLFDMASNQSVGNFDIKSIWSKTFTKLIHLTACCI